MRSELKFIDNSEIPQTPSQEFQLVLSHMHEQSRKTGRNPNIWLVRALQAHA